MTHQSRKNLSAYGMLSRVKAVAKKLPNQVLRNGEKAITLTDCLMSAIAMFGLKYSSLLSFNESFKEDTTIADNLRTLYFVKTTPSDTTMRERLDPVEPERLRKMFTKLFSLAQRDKALESYNL